MCAGVLKDKIWSSPLLIDFSTNKDING